VIEVSSIMSEMAATSTDAPPIADDLFDVDGGQLVLLASRCGECRTVAFPRQPSCPRCTSERVEAHRLATEGTLWTWTTQGFRPKSPPYTGPEEFTEYAVGYVELGEEIRVEGLLTESAPERLSIGMPMRVTALVVPGAGGEARTTYGFEPIEDAP
jgi:uncharacterized protein